MRVIFMGTPSFAVPTLQLLALHHEVVAVFARPDGISGRGSEARPSPVKLAAAALGLPVHQPASLRDNSACEAIRALAADIICVAAYGLILPVSILAAAPQGAVNVHASLLPRWRGAAPIQHAILADDPEVGISIMRMEEGLDTGPFCAQEAVYVGRKYAPALTEELAVLGAHALIDALPHIGDGTARWTQQDESHATYASKVTKADVAPDPGESAATNVTRVRASMPTSPARLLLSGKGITLAEVEAVPSGNLGPGGIELVSEGVLLGTRQGAILATRLKPDGKAEMDAVAWFRGARLTRESTWESAR